MRKRIYPITLILLLILAMGILFGVQREVSVSEKRELMTSEEIRIEELSQDTDEVLKDQFVFRDGISRLYYRIRIFFSRLFGSSWVRDAKITALTDEVSELEDGYLLNAPLFYSEEDLKAAASRGYNVREFAERYPELSVYVYFPTRLEELLSSAYGYLPECQNSFIAQLPSNVKHDSLKLESAEDYKKYYYRTDSHWNAYGAYQGYQDIIAMIRKDFELSEVRQIKEEVSFPYEFYGNITSKIARLSDAEQLVNLKLEGEKPFDYYVNHEAAEYEKSRREYAEKGNSTAFSDYDLYFGDNSFLREFDFHQNERPNLLIFGDSYVNTNMEWIASHFNRTVIVDLRAKDASFDLDALIKEKEIDAVLVMFYYNNMYFNGNEYIPLP